MCQAVYLLLHLSRCLFFYLLASFFLCVSVCLSLSVFIPLRICRTLVCVCLSGCGPCLCLFVYLFFFRVYLSTTAFSTYLYIYSSTYLPIQANQYSDLFSICMYLSVSLYLHECVSTCLYLFIYRSLYPLLPPFPSFPLPSPRPLAPLSLRGLSGGSISPRVGALIAAASKMDNPSLVPNESFLGEIEIQHTRGRRRRGSLRRYYIVLRRG